MSVFRIGDVYHYRFVHHGRVIRRSTKQGNYRAALELEAAARTALSMGDANLGERPKAPTLQRFLIDRVKPWAAKKKPTTTLWYRSGILPLLDYKPLAACSLDEITSEKTTDYAAHRDAQGRVVGTINRELRVLRRVLRLAAEWGELQNAPKVSMAGPEKRRERVVGDGEFRKYLECASPLLADVAIVLNETGLRPDECHRLEWPRHQFRRWTVARALWQNGSRPPAIAIDSECALGAGVALANRR